MKKIFVAAAIIAMFAAVSCKNNEKKAEEAACPETEAAAPAADPTVAEQLDAAAQDAAVEVGTAAIDAAADAVLEKL